jgi:hypothetical protein
VNCSYRWLLACWFAGCAIGRMDPDAAPAPDGGPAGCEERARQCTSGRLEICVDGAFELVETCDVACDPALGCVACDPEAGNACGPEGVHACELDGTIGELVEACPSGRCTHGRCDDPCAAAASAGSYIGCEYWAVDLDNNVDTWGPPLDDGSCPHPRVLLRDVDMCVTEEIHEGQSFWIERDVCEAGRCEGYTQPARCERRDGYCFLDAAHAPFAIVVANADDEHPAEVTVSDALGTTHTRTIAPGAIETIFPQQLGFADHSIPHAGVTASAYHIRSTSPIVAYQFNPLRDVDVFSNDGTILLPVHTYGTEYRGLAWAYGGHNPGFLSIVASEDGTTHVTVDTRCATRSGPGVEGGAAGSREIELQRGEVLTVESLGITDDLTGSLIRADRPIAVFGGHESALVIDPGVPNTYCCLDHLETQLPPTNAWGRSYAVARSTPRYEGGRASSDLVRIVARRDGTHVTFSSPSLTCPVLNAGERCDVVVSSDVAIEADQPILVGQFLTAISGLGDPALTFVPPIEQYLDRYTFLTPSQYEDNYVSISARVGDPVMIDGVDRSAELVPFGDGDLAGMRISVGAGRHRIECDGRCGVIAHGWGPQVAYLFAAGLDVQPLLY